MQGVYESADQMSDIIKRGTNYAMLRNERERIYQIIKSIAEEPGILKIRIYNKEGTISFSTEPSEVNTSVNLQAEACTVCHHDNNPPIDLSIFQRARDYYNSDGTHVLGVINPIKSEQSCVMADCHAHNEKQRVLGVIDVIMLLDKVDSSLVENEKRFIWNILLAILAICIVSILFIYFMVHRRVKKIVRGTEKVANGDLDFMINIDARDEIGGLAFSFNKMTEELKNARNEITNWALTLERQVEVRTDQLKSAQEKMIQTEKMASVGRLAAIVAHEINNPLAGIRTYAKLLLRKLKKHPALSEAENFEKNLSIIESESARCGDIVRNLLQFSRPSQLELKKQDIRTLVEDSLGLVQHQIKLLNIEVKKIWVDEPIEVFCDGQKMKQAFVALLINACDAVSKGNGIITIECRVDTQKNGVEISMTDNGIGMDKETQAHMFEPFFTTKENVGKHEANLGLGVSVVFEIVKSHGGEILVKSKVGEGTSITIFIPAQSPDQSEV